MPRSSHSSRFDHPNISCIRQVISIFTNLGERLWMAFIGVAIMPVFMKNVHLIQTLKGVNKNRNFQRGNLINVLSCLKKWKQAKESERKVLWMFLCDATYSIASTVKIICDNRYKYLLYLSQARCGETSVLIYAFSVYRPEFCGLYHGCQVCFEV